MAPDKASLAVELLRFLRSPTGLVVVVLALVGVGLCSWAEVMAIVRPTAQPAPPAQPPLAIPNPRAVPVEPVAKPHEPAFALRLFDEYPLVRDDIRAHPIETRFGVWVSFRHLAPKSRPGWMERWKSVAALKPVGTDTGLYRFECGGKVAAEFVTLMADYPYAIAPGPRIEQDLAAAYREVENRSPFSVPCVVRGDWLFGAAGGRPAFAAALGLKVSPADREAARDEKLDPAEVFGPDAALGVRMIKDESAGTLTRRWLETDAGRGSGFVRWARAAGLGIPVY